MREVDTDALQLVAPALGIGNPATATLPVVFDDENLQQTLDVGRYIAPRGFRGELSVSRLATVGVTVRDQTARSSLFTGGRPWDAELLAFGLESATTDVWLMSAQVLVDVDNDNISEVSCGILFDGDGMTGTQPAILWHAEALEGTVPLIAAGSLLTSNALSSQATVPYLYPIFLPFGAGTVILDLTVADGVGTLNALFTYHFWFAQRGVPLTYEI